MLILLINVNKDIVQLFILKEMWENNVTDLETIIYLSSMVPVAIKKTHAYKSSVKLTKFQEEATHGLMLGDIYAERAKEGHNTRLCFNLASFSYITHLRELFDSLTAAAVNTHTRKPDPRTGVVYISHLFKTLALPSLNFIRDLYYVPNFGKGIKVIPADLGDYFTTVSLAYWIMDDGMYAAGGMRLCTDSFTLEQVQFLCALLHSKFGIKCAPQLRNGVCWRIYIPVAEMDNVRSLVKPYLLPSMLYKVGL